VRIVTSLEKFCASPSSVGLLELLADVRSKAIEIDDAAVAALERASLFPVEFRHKSVFEFDEQLWLALDGLLPEIDWLDVWFRWEGEGEDDSSEKESNTSPFSEEQLLQFQAFGQAAAESAISEQESVKEAEEKTGNRFYFFASVNRWFQQEQGFERFIAKSIELEELLSPLSEIDSADRSTPKGRLRACSWRWVSQAVAAVYLSGLDALKSKGNPQEVVIAAHLLCLGHGSLFHTTARVAGFGPSVNLVQKISEFPSGLSFGGGGPMFYKPLAASLAGSDDLESIEGVGEVLWMSGATFCARAGAWDIFVPLWVSGRHSLDDDSLDRYSKLIFSLVRAVKFSTFSDGKLDQYLSLIEREGSDSIDMTAVADALEKIGAGGVPSPRVSCYLLGEVWEGDLECIARRLVELTNRRFEETGFPMTIPLLAAGMSAADEWMNLFTKRSVFYESLSTLAANLLSPEHTQLNFDTETAARCYLNATARIARAGYREHAAVFLGYALFRSAFLIKSEFDKGWPIVELESCITTHLPERWVRQYVVPILRLIADGVDWPPAFRIWLESRIGESEGSVGKLLEFRRPVTDGDASAEIVVPPWFEGGTDALRDSLVRLRRAFAEADVSGDSWHHVSHRHGAKDAIGELLRQLEAQLKHYFQDVYEVLQERGDLRAALWECIGTRGFDPCRGPLTWGWIEFLLGNVADVQDSRSMDRAFRALRQAANDALPGLGEVFAAIRGKTELVAALGRARKADNHFTSHNEPIRRQRDASASRGVVQGRRIPLGDARWLYHYVTVDFGDLFAILKPILREELE
jgi:hypothetical protein